MDKLKTIAMYLPQFHEVPENSEWWGEGFTDWNAVKAAQPLFEGHNQPREPLEDNYYNLLEKETMLKQSDMARLYDLDGFCFYHYYFKDGRKILEKPAENLLKWKDVPMQFCFCWANETWARTWSNIKVKNVWADNFENKIQNGSGILLEQKYDREKAWKEHFNYLLPFFKDDRYIKLSGMPVFLIYKPSDIKCLAEMVAYWRILAKENDFSDIYVIGLNTIEKRNGLDAVLFNGPTVYRNSGFRGKQIKDEYINEVKYCLYDKVWENAIKAESVEGCKTYFGAFTDYDDTPRRGKKGWFFKDSSIELYEKYLYKIMRKNRYFGNEFQFINAFNEWGEGMYMEPDKKIGYSYLEITKKIKQKVNEESNFEEYEKIQKVQNKSIDKIKLEKYQIYMKLFDTWMMLREKKIHINQYLSQYNYKKIAIYGYGMFGKHLLTELLEDKVDIRCIIDQKSDIVSESIKSYTLDNYSEDVDAIIITPIFDYDEIWEKIKQKGIKASLISLREIIEYLADEIIMEKAKKD